MKSTDLRTRIDLAPEVRDRMIESLNQQLADTFDLHSQTKQAHWNVKGAQFFPLHQLFDELAKELAENADSLAERVTALGATAMGTVRMSAEASRLSEWQGDATADLHCFEMLADRFSSSAGTRALPRLMSLHHGRSLHSKSHEAEKKREAGYPDFRGSSLRAG